MCYAVALQGGDNGDNLAVVVDIANPDPTTNETNIGTGTGTLDIQAIAYDLTTNTLYAVDGESDDAQAGDKSPIDQMGTIDLVTGLFTPLPEVTGLENIYAMTYDLTTDQTTNQTTEILYAVDRVPQRDQLYQIDPATGHFIPDAYGTGKDYLPIVNVTFFKMITGIAVDPTDGQMYATASKKDDNGSALLRVDKETGDTELIGELSFDGWEGLTFHNDGRLFAITGSEAGANANKIWEIDKTTGVEITPCHLDNGIDYRAVDCPVEKPDDTNQSSANPAVVNYPTTSIQLASYRPSSGVQKAIAAPLLVLPPEYITTITTINYEYDPLYRLKEANYDTGGFFHYTYDAVGNRETQSINGLTTTYVYNEANRLTYVDSQPYNWDENGNLKNDGTNTYEYDYANRLTELTQGTTTYTFAYNGLGDRLSQTINTQTTTYTLDLNAGLTQVLSDGANSYLYGLGRIAEYESDWAYYLPDALGSVRQITDPTGGLTLLQSYQPYQHHQGMGMWLPTIPKLPKIAIFRQKPHIWGFLLGRGTWIRTRAFCSREIC